MAYIVSDDDEELDGNRESGADEQTQQPEQAEATEQPVKKPGKFEGKSQADIEAAYEELERSFGRQGAELGELRKQVDTYIRSSLTPKEPAAPKQQEPEQDDSQFFVEPRKAVANEIENHPAVQELREFRRSTQAERAKAAFNAKHPDADAVLADPEFRAWVEASPRRVKTLLDAHTNHDVDAADDIFSTFKEVRAAKIAANAEKVKEAAEAKLDEAKRAAGAAVGTTGAGGGGKKQTFSRAKLMRMMVEDPEQYAALNDEIIAAYAEGRVTR